MTALAPFYWQIFHCLFLLALAPLLMGIVRRVRARLQGRHGATPWQPYRDLWKLSRKIPVLATNASPVTVYGPAVSLVAIIMAVQLVPAVTTELALAPVADLIALVALLGLARASLALAGLDIGTAFGGIGASRDLLLGALAEPAMMMAIFTLSLVAESTALPKLVSYVLDGHVGLEVSLALVLIAMIMVALAENGRIPIDNPTTHLELTMVHEAMVLDHSGRHLALIEYAQMVKLMLFFTLIATIYAPWGIDRSGTVAGVLLGAGWFAVKLISLSAILPIFEASLAKMRVFRVPEFLGGALLLALLATLFRLVAEAV